MASKVKNIISWVIGVTIIALIVLVSLLIFGNLSGNTGIPDKSITIAVTNESYNGLTQGAWINQTGYTLKKVNSSNSGYTITEAWNQTANGGVIETDNYSVSASGVVRNTTAIAPFNNYNNVSLSYTYKHTFNSYTEDITESVISNYTSGANKLTAQIPLILLFVGISLLLFVLIGVLAWIIKRMLKFSNTKERVE